MKIGVSGGQRDAGGGIGTVVGWALDGEESGVSEPDGGGFAAAVSRWVTVTPIAAFKGGISAKAAGELMDKSVLPEKPDLVVIAFGLNDAAGAVKGAANNPPEKYKERHLAGLIHKAKRRAGGEVLLVVPFEGNPSLLNGMGAAGAGVSEEPMLELSKEENVGRGCVHGMGEPGRRAVCAAAFAGA